MQKITPCLWFDGQAEEAVNYYTSIFRNSKILKIARFGEAGSDASGQPPGTVMTVLFRLEGQEYLALNGGPTFKFSEAVSFIVNCRTQKEIDYYWEKLSEGGEEGQCGWLKDRYGLSWQIVPARLGEMMQDRDPERANRVMQAMLAMKKIDITIFKAGLQQALS
ncbi:MAG TPA: VOC family protein [Spirochaetota bacterium]|nr:VOC family protein [Spirochaetota bacterium]HOD13356.1 VOC family protein [Spirochaetota bacterium]HPG51584.1 VOC family protein [Spirochaetota bacterium]HPN11827.1 VOC family protein [Spirochaetota bacterium]HQL80841.1 VOC family protein [Spirochaetota bacterium]